VLVNGTRLAGYTIEFIGALAGQDVTGITADLLAPMRASPSAPRSRRRPASASSSRSRSSACAARRPTST
jgi:hypothetical protein